MSLKHISVRLLLSLVLGIGWINVWAQGEASEDAPPQANEKKTEAPTKTSPDNKKTSRSSEDSPFDYQASEEISQDLSVSFPVDI